jgi:Predicted Zn-dependent hydrolases of the beta-lactamase fold
MEAKIRKLKYESGEHMKKGLELIKEINDCVIEPGNAAFWWLGQMGQVIKLGDTVIYVDAFLSEWPNRNVASLLKPEEITNADFILGTHDHSDHIDREVWHQLSVSSPTAVFVVPNYLVDLLSKDLDIPRDRFRGLDDGVSLREKGITITAIPSAHEFLDRDVITGSYPYLGYVMEKDGCILYHSGDSCIYEGMYQRLRELGHIDAMFIPINGRDAKRYRENIIGNMTYQEAVDLAGVLKPGVVVPGHYDMFSFNDVSPRLFTDYLEVKYPDVKYWIGNHGEMVSVFGGRAER